MPDASPDATPDGALAPDGDPGQVPDPDAPDAPDGQQGKTYSESYVRQLRREASGYRNRLAELEEQNTQRQEAEKSENERLSERATTAEQRAKDAESRLLRFEIAAERGLDLKA